MLFFYVHFIIKRMKKSHNTWFVNFLISYILITLIPLLGLGALYTYNLYKVYEEKVIDAEKGDVDFISSHLANELGKIKDICDQIHLSELVPYDYSFETKPLYANKIKTTLRTFVIPSSFYDDVYYYEYDDEYLYSNTSTYKKELFFANVHALGTDTSFSSSMDNIQTASSYYVFNSFLNSKVIMLCFPLYNYSHSVKGVIMFAIKDSSFDRYISSLVNHPYSYELKDSLGNLLSSHKEAIESERSYSFEVLGTDWCFSIEFQDEKLFTSEDFFALIPFFIALLIILVLSGCAIVHFTRHNYEPIEKLHNKVKEIGAVEEGGKNDEFKVIEGTINKLNSVNEDLKQELVTLQEEKVNVELQKLVTGGFYKSYEEFKAVNGDRIDLSGKYFIFTIVHFAEVCSEMEDFAIKVRTSLNEICNNYYIYTPFARRLYFISNFDDKEKEVEIKKRLVSLRPEMEVEYGNVLTLGLSSTKSGILSIPTLMLEASSSLNYRFIKGKGTTIFFDDISEPSGDESYPKSSMDNLKKAIVSHSQDAIEYGLDDFLNFIDEHPISLFEVKGICFDILQTFMLSNPDIREKSNLRDEILKLSDMGTASEIVERIRAYRKRTEKVESECTSADLEIIEKVKMEVNKNCLDCNFSVQLIADNIGINVSKLSSLYSNVTGECLVYYISSVRMNEARKLLETTELPIKEISSKVGYYNVSSFIRRFRQIQGMSPGDYRKMFS